MKIQKNVLLQNKITRRDNGHYHLVRMKGKKISLIVKSFLLESPIQLRADGKFFPKRVERRIKNFFEEHYFYKTEMEKNGVVQDGSHVFFFKTNQELRMFISIYLFLSRCDVEIYNIKKKTEIINEVTISLDQIAEKTREEFENALVKLGITVNAINSNIKKLFKESCQYEMESLAANLGDRYEPKEN